MISNIFFSSQHLFGQKNINVTYFLDISKHLINSVGTDGSLANLFGILLILKRIKVNIVNHMKVNRLTEYWTIATANENIYGKYSFMKEIPNFREQIFLIQKYFDRFSFEFLKRPITLKFLRKNQIDYPSCTKPILYLKNISLIINNFLWIFK